MRKHKTTMADMIRGRCTDNGLTLETLSRKTGISPATMSRRMSDGKWNLSQIQEMHRFLHFTTQNAAIIMGGSLEGPQMSSDLANQLLNAIVQAVKNEANLRNEETDDEKD